MTKLYFDFNDGLFHFKIDKDTHYFNSIIILLRDTYHCGYKPDSKTWTTKSAINAYSAYLDLKSYDKVIVSQEDLDLITDFIYPEDDSFRKIKLSVDQELLQKHPPLIGKEGFENFQIDAITRGLRQNKIILDISMGHGKSYIFSMILGSLLKLNRIDRCLIVCRLEGVENIKLELLRFLEGIIVEDDIGIVSTDNRAIEDLFETKKIIITNYITFRLSGDYYNKLKSKGKSVAKKPKKKYIDFTKWGNNRLLLLDESQEINNYDSIQSHFIHLYKNDFNRIIDMSGSLGYKFIHYYSHIKLLLPNAIPYSFSEWTSYIAEKSSKHRIEAFREDKVKEFKERLIDKVQVTYRDCLVLPENIETIIYVSMNEKFREIYKTYIQKEVNRLKIKKEKDISGDDIRNDFSTIAQIVSDPILLSDENRKGWRFTDSPKLQVLKSLLERYIEEEGQKVIVWSVHPKILNLLKVELKKYKPIVIHGDEKSSIPKKDRFRTAMEFQDSKDSSLALFSYVMSTSINMVKVTRQIYWDMPLDSDDFIQSKMRIHREGQKNKVKTDYLQYNNSLDVYIWEEILIKKSDTKNILSSKESLTLEDYNSVFNRKGKPYLAYKG